MRLVPAIVLLLVLAGASPARAQQFPDTPGGRHARGFFEVMRSGQEAAAREFITGSYSAEALAARPVDSRLQAYRTLQADLAEPKLLESDYPDGAARLVIESGASGQTYEVRIEYAGDPPKIMGVRVGPGSAGRPPIPPGPLSDARKAELLGQYLDKLTAEDRFSGVVMLAKDGKPVFERACGLANQSFAVPNRVDTKFCLGSMNKMFTSVAIAKLVEQGKLAYQDKVGKHLPDFPNAAVRDKVTIHHLLTHTSGLGSYFDSPEYEARFARLRRVADYEPIVAAETLAFEPGSDQSYSNSGFIVLGLLIEKVSGQDYYDFVRENVFAPAGMTDSDSYAMDEPVPNLAVGYTRESPDGPRHHGAAAGPRRTNYLLHSIRGTPAGGGFSTAPDLLKFARALPAGKIVSASLFETMTTPQVPMGPDFGYGYGMGVTTRMGRKGWGHNGGAPGMSTEFRDYPGLGYTMIVLSNYDGAAGPIADFLEEMIVR